MNKCRESVSVCSSIFLLPPQSPDRAIALLEIIFDIMGKVEVTRYKSFRRPLLPLEMAMPPLPFFPYSCLKCLFTFPMWIYSLRPWSFLPALKSLSIRNACTPRIFPVSPFLGPASRLEPPPSFTAHPSGLLLPYFADLHLFFFFIIKHF